MKRLLSLLLLVVAPPVGAQVMVMKNSVGGHIVLTAKPCALDGGRYKTLRAMYSYSNDNRAVFGCWAIADGEGRGFGRGGHGPGPGGFPGGPGGEADGDNAVIS